MGVDGRRAAPKDHWSVLDKRSSRCTTFAPFFGVGRRQRSTLFAVLEPNVLSVSVGRSSFFFCAPKRYSLSVRCFEVVHIQQMHSCTGRLLDILSWTVVLSRRLPAISPYYLFCTHRAVCLLFDLQKSKRWTRAGLAMTTSTLKHAHVATRGQCSNLAGSPISNRMCLHL